jgi:tetratricopeptide (TPR) repeat protein
MSPRVRVFATVALAAAAAAATVVGITLATRQTPEQPQARKDKPPFVFDRRTPVEDAIKAAFRAWPRGTLARMEALGKEYPRDAVVQFHLGIARLYSGYVPEAVTALRTAKRLGRDTPYEIRADNLLHPQFFGPGYPIFQPTRRNALLQRGARLQAEGRQHSAERLYARAARVAPRDDEAQVAAAVGRFDMDRLSDSFSRLGPLTRRFPRSQSVRFHLGLMLAWTGERRAAIEQFRRARALGPGTVLGREADAFLSRLESNGTKRDKR